MAAPAPPSAAVSTLVIKMHHYNICDGIPAGTCTRAQADHAKDILHWQKTALGPWFVSVNEMCLSSWQQIAQLWKSDAAFVITTDGAGSGACVRAEFLCMKYLLELASGFTQPTPTVLTNRYRSKPKTLPYCRASRSTVCA